jgi:hypothetical protein
LKQRQNNVKYYNKIDKEKRISNTKEEREKKENESNISRRKGKMYLIHLFAYQAILIIIRLLGF